MPSYLATSSNAAIQTAEQVLLDGTQAISGVEDVLVDNQSVVRDNIARIDLSGKQDKLTVTQDLTLDGADLGVNKEKIQEKLIAGKNITIDGTTIDALKNEILVVKGTDIADKDALTATLNRYAVIVIYDDNGLQFTWLRSDQGLRTAGSLYQYLEGYRVIKDDYDWPQDGNWSQFMAWCNDHSQEIATKPDIKIDSISLNGSALTPDENKQVNITIDKAALGLANVDNTSDSEKPVSAAQQAAINEVGNKLNKDLVTAVSTDLTGDTLNINVTTENLSTGATASDSSKIISTATQDSAGLMSSSDVRALADIKSRVDRLEGKTTRLLYTASTNPTAEQIDEFVRGLGYDNYEGIAVVIKDTYHIWHYYANGNIGWRDDGQDTVSTFTNEVAGLIKGADQVEGKVYAESDGTGSIYGWDALKSQVEENKTNLANKADISLLNGKLDAVTGSTAVNQVYAKNADGTQTMLDVGGTASENIATVGQTEPYHITLTGYSGNVTEEQYNKLKNDDRSYIVFTNDKIVLTKGKQALQYFGSTGVAQWVLTINAEYKYSCAVINLEQESNKKNKITDSGNDTFYPSTKAVVDYVKANAETTANKTTTIDNNSTDTQYPSALAAYAYGQIIQTNAQTYANTAETNAKAYADSLIGNVNELLTKIDSGEGV